MRSSNSKIQGKVEGVNSESPLENGLPPKEEEDVRELAAQVVDDVVKMASAAAQQKTTDQNSTPKKNRGCNLQRLPTIQIDTVQSEPSSPVDLTPPDESAEEPLDESDIQLDLDTTEQVPEDSTEELREHLKSYVEDVLSQAMVVAEKKLQFVGVPEEDEDEDQEEEPSGLEQHPEETPSSSELEKEETPEDPEIRAAAEKVVQEVIEKASETAAQKLENGIADLSFPGLPSIQIDACKSAPPSPESEEETQPPQKKWTFTMLDDSDSETSLHTEEPLQPPEKRAPITYDEAPDDVKELATSFVKDIVGRAVAAAEEKSVPTVPFNFEDVDLMKTSGPWYVRAREALVRVLRTACFCTPRRNDS